MVKTQGRVSDRGEPGSLERDIDVELLSLVWSGCDVDGIVRELRLPLREVHQRLVSLRLVIEDVAHSASR